MVGLLRRALVHEPNDKFSAIAVMLSMPERGFDQGLPADCILLALSSGLGVSLGAPLPRSLKSSAALRSLLLVRLSSPSARSVYELLRPLGQ